MENHVSPIHYNTYNAFFTLDFLQCVVINCQVLLTYLTARIDNSSEKC